MGADVSKERVPRLLLLTDFWHGLIFDLEKKVVGLERGPLSLVSTTEELLDRKVAAPV
jgi:hypothetical protein